MDEGEQPSWSGEGPTASAEVSERIRSILAGAEAAASAVRHEAEQHAQARKRQAETDALRIIEDARREAERFLAERIKVVSDLSDDLLKRGQALVERLDAADEVRTQLADLVMTLGNTAARLANEVRSMPGPQTPDIASVGGATVVRGDAPELAAPVEPVAPAHEPEPTPAAPEPEPLREPTPLRREPEPEPADEPLPPAAEAEPEAEAEPAAEAEAVEPADQAEAELLAAVRAAERERESLDEEPEADEETQTGEAARAANAASTLADLEADVDLDVGVVELRAAAEAPEAQEEHAETPVAARPVSADQTLGARLVALQMAVAGGNRGEVEAHLRRAFELADPGDILDDIFGSGTDSDKRVVWPEAG